jgi:hypothetical protein
VAEVLTPEIRRRVTAKAGDGKPILDNTRVTPCQDTGSVLRRMSREMLRVMLREMLRWLLRLVPTVLLPVLRTLMLR